MMRHQTQLPIHVQAPLAAWEITVVGRVGDIS